MGLLAPPRRSNLLQFHAVFGENGQNNKFTLPLLGPPPPGEILDPSLQCARRLKTACSSRIYRYEMARYKVC